MLIHEIFIVALSVDDVSRDGIRDGQVRLRRHRQMHVRPFSGRGFACGEVDDLHPGSLAFAFQNPREQHRVHFGHVVAPKHEGVALFEIVVAAHGFVCAEGGHKSGDRARHAETRVGLHVVRANAAFEPFEGGIAIRNGPLSGAVNSHGFRTVPVQRLLVFACHQIQSCIPGRFLEFAVAPNEGFGQPIFTIENARQTVAFNAQQSLVDRIQLVAGHSHDFAILSAHHHTATRSAKTARRFIPGQIRIKLNFFGKCRRFIGTVR